jgi:LCP family protein required for cell wall assembly
MTKMKKTAGSENHFLSVLGRMIALTLSGLAILLLLVFLVVTVAPVRMAAMHTVLSIAGASPPQDSLGHTNILLLGVGDKHHDGADLTDTMMIASIDPKTRSAVLLSIPRDLYVSGNKELPDGRINTTYVYEKNLLRAQNKKISDTKLSELALQKVGEEMGRKLGIPIHGVIKVDFTAVVNTVDALGGVDVVVQKPITDYTYPLEEGVTGLFHLDAGPQHLDGETALKFARSRHSGTDFDRSLRQQQLIQALSEKIQNMTRFQQISFVNSLLKSVVNHLDTTMTTSQILGLTQLGTELSMQNIVTMQINFGAGSDSTDARAGGFVYSADPADYQGADVLLPSVLPTDKTGWGQIQTFASFLINHRELYLSKQHLQVVNVSANTLAAYRLENELRRYGFTVDPEPKKSKPVAGQKAVQLPASFVTFMEEDDKSIAGFFGGLLHMTLSQQSSTDRTGTGSDVRIVLGKDYTYQPFQVLTKY